jgi:uncharacterized protein YbgA (DUF1722 family)
MTYSQEILKELGNLIASHKEDDSLEVLLGRYLYLFKEVLSENPKRGNHVNVLFHIFGHMSDKLKEGEKHHFFHLIERYKATKIELNIITELLKNWAYRFENEYLLSQTYLQPYPEELEN